MCIPRLCTISRHDSQHQHGVGLNTISDLRLSMWSPPFMLYEVGYANFPDSDSQA